MTTHLCRLVTVLALLACLVAPAAAAAPHRVSIATSRSIVPRRLGQKADIFSPMSLSFSAGPLGAMPPLQQTAAAPVYYPTRNTAAPSRPAAANVRQSAPQPPAGIMASILSFHNTVRARHQAGPLAWSPSLAAASQQWADACVWGHSGVKGENLAQYFPNPLDGVKVWYDEISMYNYGAGLYSSATGHATQMLWRASTEVGCGWAPTCQYLVCRYMPKGNVRGYFIDNVYPPSS